VGGSPILPAANCAFCSFSTRIRSVGVSFNWVSRSGLTQMRMA
jgi:hypothetical protein